MQFRPMVTFAFLNIIHNSYYFFHQVRLIKQVIILSKFLNTLHFGVTQKFEKQIK
jgi:hypothetical protein